MLQSCKSCIFRQLCLAPAWGRATIKFSQPFPGVGNPRTPVGIKVKLLDFGEPFPEHFDRTSQQLGFFKFFWSFYSQNATRAFPAGLVFLFTPCRHKLLPVFVPRQCSHLMESPYHLWPCSSDTWEVWSCASTKAAHGSLQNSLFSGITRGMNLLWVETGRDNKLISWNLDKCSHPFSTCWRDFHFEAAALMQGLLSGVSEMVPMPWIGAEVFNPSTCPQQHHCSSTLLLLCLAEPELYTNPCFVLLCRNSANTERPFIFSIFIFRCWGKKMSKCLQLFQPEQSEHPEVIFPLTFSAPRMWTEGGFSASIIPSVLIIFFQSKKTHYLQASLEEWIWQALIQMNV